MFIFQLIRIYKIHTIIHLPTNTYYYLLHTKSKHNVVVLKKYEDAKYVADSWSTHNWIYDSCPSDNKELYIIIKKRIPKRSKIIKSKHFEIYTVIKCGDELLYFELYVLCELQNHVSYDQSKIVEHLGCVFHHHYSINCF